ncbi:MAG: dephospho-CoA kinase [Deltaproteobacteria bacterium]|nr:dephospho-CoA kinase [Deltaproteobacteria bacterium]NCP02302.1 dephospho-CoA kinase [Deltaproteobacteria bacterium]
MVLGLTGNIASGKSLVARLLAVRGAEVLSADALAREVVAPGSAVLLQLVQQFGDQILDAQQALDRGALAERVFADPQALAALNRLTHPAIARLADERLAALRAANIKLIVYEAPLLFEAAAEKRVDQVLVVTIDPVIQLQRLMARDGFGRDDALRRIGSQMPQEQKAARADYLIDNSGSLADLEAAVNQLWTRLNCNSLE